MTQPDSVNNPPVSFVGRLNRTLCFFWLILNIFIFIVSFYALFRTPSFKEYIGGVLILDGGYILIYSLIVTIVYLASGRLLNPLGNKLTTLFTFWGSVLGGVAITFVLFIILTGIKLFR